MQAIKTFATAALLLVATPAWADAPTLLSPETRNRCMQTLRDGLTSDQFWPSMHAAEALTLAGYGEEVRSALTPKLPNVQDAQHRCGVARELFRAGDESAVATLWEVLGSDDPYGHNHACESLFKIRQMGDGKLLRQHLADETLPIKQLLAAAALAQHGDSEAKLRIHDFLIGDDDNMARLAAWTMAVSGDSSDLAALRERAKSITNPQHLVYFHAALARFGDADGKTALQADLKHEDPMVRVYAAEFCGHSNISAALPVLTELLEDENLDVRIRAAQALTMLGTNA
ncbi:HEAT repeat domain-containing protein [Blastopirellula sp. JC732]|uniref:HEAT repeat domain-containing protein n=1 Tax=Blastopirellula sediminis TaxID=2894196 RepID=A0A9X1MRQ1_9BACT|nr:HEAT repeat domain-containing protein [Blastopirellula sediminis]MCC9605555.1 HEAT repeat domain-containing protein [Blastopirellula sediminis]MCC9631145.1 HEAT repeat domain-containing protein [Blastopirellula sediminis]